MGEGEGEGEACDREGRRKWDKETIQVKSDRRAAAELICHVKYQQMFYYAAVLS